MPTRKQRTPSYRLHKPSGQAVVTLYERDFYLGPHGSAMSRGEYDRLVLEWLHNGRRMLDSTNGVADVTVAELLAAYWKHAERPCLATPRAIGEMPARWVCARELRPPAGHLSQSRRSRVATTVPGDDEVG